MTWEQILSRWPQSERSAPTVAEEYSPPGGETFPEVRERIDEALRDLAGLGLERMLVVTHAGPLHAVLHHYFSGSPDLLAVRFAPASITRIRVDEDGAELLALNDMHHL